MKRHGLWRFHRQAKSVKDFRWWVPEETERVYRMIDALRVGYGAKAEYSNADAIVKCAKRYASLYRASIRTVGEWNGLVSRIAERAGFTHHATMRAAMIEGAREKSRIRFFFNEEFSRPHAPSVDCLTRRAESIAKARLERLSTMPPCRWCGSPVLMRESWGAYSEYTGVHCNSRDCRRIHYLSRKRQSQGGIDLTPRQEKASPYESWDTQRVANYLALRAKESKNGSKQHQGR